MSKKSSSAFHIEWQGRGCIHVDETYITWRSLNSDDDDDSKTHKTDT